MSQLSVLGYIILLANPTMSMELSNYQWKNRVLVLNQTHSKASHQKTSFESFKRENEDRQLLLLEVNAQQRSLWNRFGFEKGKFQLVLVGKDGSEKKRFSEPTNMEAVYEIIDAMPMRQQEMKIKPKGQ